VAPAAVEIRATSSGKPEIDPAYGIMFNTSRSGPLSLVAVAREPVGVDVEQLRPLDDAVEMAEVHFAEKERQLMSTVPSASRDETFLALWTRKEAVVKAFGVGLAVPLDSFEVAAAAGAPAGAWHAHLDSAPFVVEQLDAPSGWVAAVSVVGTRLTVRRMDSATLHP
jgi:4'-phosphopantetheinyl transferase